MGHIFAMWFKKNMIHPFWRTVILPIDIHSTKTRGICCFVHFYKDVAPLVLYQNIIIRYSSFEIYFPLKSLQDALLCSILTGKGERFSAPTNEKSAPKNYVSYVAMWQKNTFLFLFSLKKCFTVNFFPVVKNSHSCILICGYALRSLIFPITPNTSEIFYNPNL
jgi:hypothetical protein